MNIIGTKFIGKYEKKGFLYYKHKIEHIDDIKWEELVNIININEDFDDYEDAFMNGVTIDYNDKIQSICVDKIIDWINRYISDGDEYSNKLVKLKNKLIPYNGYVLEPSEDEE